MCGDCCTGAQVVRLTGQDLGLLMRHLGLASVRDLKTKGLVTLVREPVGPQRSVWRPRIRFRSHPLVQCPFLLNDIGASGNYRGLCTLHPDAKPLVCALSPLTREVEDAGAGPVVETWSFVPPVEGCPGTGRGPRLDLRAPGHLAGRLAQEVSGMRRWTDESCECPDEESAWDMLGAQGALG